ncbi:hypothetical protein [Prevotella sp. E2-28]|uniref:putative polyvalent protein kinase domain-containing protein n=1 Tax=Prevotella sp. E2-28 TaxID=2913620 RepID=UPI001EDBD8D3|nr:hypothetical protein [Prevotella sp. E2-28]UKK54297.1 hypothetical protein L6465_03300 [Prevotella sp. E2-28]
MSDDISQSVSQRGNGAYDEENLRIQEVSNELQRLCRLHEEESGNGKANGTRFEIEQRAAEQYAKSAGIWIPMDNVFDLGIPGPSGNENDTYVSKDTIYKVNNLLNSGGICKLFGKVLLHNLLFPNTAYRLYGLTGYDGRTVMPVLEQERICEAQPATQIMIDTYMSALGFVKDDNEAGRFSNNQYLVWDLVPRNVLVDKDGDMYVVDAEIARRNQ